MLCAGTKYCSVMSYHPESTSANYFLAYTTQFSIGCYWNCSKWPHRENVKLQNIDKNVLGIVPDFESLKLQLRTFISPLSTNPTK